MLFLREETKEGTNVKSEKNILIEKAAREEQRVNNFDGEYWKNVNVKDVMVLWLTTTRFVYDAQLKQIGLCY